MLIFVKLVCFFHVLRFKKSCLLLYEFEDRIKCQDLIGNCCFLVGWQLQV